MSFSVLIFTFLGHYMKIVIYSVGAIKFAHDKLILDNPRLSAFCENFLTKIIK